MKKFGVALLVILVTLGFAACGQDGTEIKEITDRGVLRVGVKMDVPGFGFFNPETQSLEGLEVDLARLAAEAVLGDRDAIELVGVTAQTREPMLDNGELDIVIATFTITEARKALFHFTPPYFHDEIGLLVRTESGVEHFLDLNGKNVGSVQAGTAHSALDLECEANGITVIHQKYGSYPEVKAALLAGEIDAFCGDKSILRGYLDEETTILNDGFHPQDYGIASKLDNAALGDYLDEWLESIRADGTLDALLSRWGQSSGQ